LTASTATDVSPDHAFLAGGGRVGALMRGHDWSKSPLGPPETWPQSLRAIVALLLHSKFPMFVAWGPELGFLYNDPYAEILGAKHPRSLGARFYDIWSEIWPDISPLIDAALAGEASYREDLPLVMNRKGYDEQTWFTFSYSPVRDESGRIAGMFCAVSETTQRRKAEEALRESRAQIEAELVDAKLLHDLSAHMIGEADTATLYEKVIDAAMAILRSDFASMQMLYPERGRGGELRLLTSRGFTPAAAKFWQWVGVDSAGTTCGAALRERRRVVVEDVENCGFIAGTPDLDVFRATGIRACQTTPLLSRSGKLVGMISTHWRTPHRPTERELRLLDVVARQAADIIERQLAEEALRHRAAQHETLLNQSPLGVYLVDADFRIREVNPVALPVFGDIPDLVGRDFDEVIHILWERAFADEIVRLFRHTLATGEPYVTPERAQRRNDRNTTEHYEWRLDRITLPDGRFGVVCHFRDIAGEVQARRTQQLLVEELNHRVKNTLASVQAIVQHTLRSAKDPADFAASFAGRIQSMARAHSLLTSTVWKGADLRDVIRDQLPLGPVDQSRLTAWGPAVHMRPQMVQHVALMLHELGTNSAKYGALASEKGWVTISWSVDDALLRLTWREQGGPPVSAPIRRGFGTTLIEQSARSEGGEARMSIEATGIAWQITIPLPEESSLSAAAASQMLDVTAPAQLPAAEPARAVLAGDRILVVEDEPLVCMDIADGLQDAGADVVGPAGTAEEARELIETTRIDAALLDGNLRGRPVDDIAAALTRRNIPFCFVTGYGAQSLPASFRHAPLLSKPFSRQQLLDAAVALVERPKAARRLSVRKDG
jgi:two-component sensor histidine kinase/CheY-like chemotaxis protein